MSKPLIQINNEIREMTDEEYAEYMQEVSNPVKQPGETE